MASKRPLADEDFSCPVCCDVYRDPVLLPCGHSACGDCARRYWRTKGRRECPLCRKRCARNPPPNLALRNLCRSFLDLRGPLEELCEVHWEKLSLFCLDDERLVCVVCRESRSHRNHACRPIDEIAAERKEILQNVLYCSTRKMKILEETKFSCDQKADYIKHQARQTEDVIKKEFEHLHQLLFNEESSMLTELKEEEKQKTQRMKDKFEKMNQEILSLSDTIRSIRNELESRDVKFLQNSKDTLKRAKCTVQDPMTDHGELINTAKYLGNLKYNVWWKIRQFISYSPVVLDPNTANSQLILSEDLTTITNCDESEEGDGGESKQPPSNVERFDRCPCVLGSVGYLLGTHTWEVDVGDNTFWMVGVSTKSVQRNGVSGFPSEVWCIGYDGELLSLKDPIESYVPLHGCEKPMRLRVKLDMKKGQLSFSDARRNALYHTFTHKFTEQVFPFFYSLCCVSPLKILPAIKPSP